MEKKETVLDPVKDFDTPTRKQQELVPEDPQAETAVRKGFAMAKFVKSIFERDKDDHPFASFEISLPLTQEHGKWVPEEVGVAWKVVEKHSYKVQNISVDVQVAEIRIAPDAEDGRIKITNAEVEQCAISKIIEKGTGEEREVIRLQFRLRVELDDEVSRFSRVHFGHNVWMKLQPLQGKLIK